MPSLIDHFQRENRWFPTGFVPEDFSEWTVEEQSMFVIRVHLPWYFSFIMSWEEAAQSHSVCWLTYEELFEDTLSTVKVACNFWNYPVDDGIVLSAIAAMDGRNTRLNKGISGRGQQLPEYQKCEIKNLAASCCLSANSLRMIGLGSGISIGNCYSA
ncbi:MAG: sulfotransferase domain-containing protein [Pirellulales bacterium]|nr:sulfotransferase domain-containing protein [Pirellulales bacterium]